MSIVITGDTHGTFDIGKVVRYFNEHEDEYTRDEDDVRPDRTNLLG